MLGYGMLYHDMCQQLMISLVPARGRAVVFGPW